MVISVVYQLISLQFSLGICEDGLGFHYLQKINGSSSYCSWNYQKHKEIIDLNIISR